jgi:uncharacterized membrane protein
MELPEAQIKQQQIRTLLPPEVEQLTGTSKKDVELQRRTFLTGGKELFSALKRFDARTQLWIAWMLLILFMLVYALEMSYQAVLRYETFKATAFDLGNMDQVLWNTIHGRLFQFTNQAIDWYGPPTRLAVHFEPIILPLSLLYAFGADPRILLVFQTIALALGAVPVFLLTRRYLPEWPLPATFMALAYLLAPALLGLNIFDFHPLSLATPLLLYAILALTYKRYRWFLVACILAAACKEDVPLDIAMLGILVIWKYKSPRLGITLIIGGLVWSFLAFFVIIPHFFPGAQHNNFIYRYDTLGSSPGELILNVLFHPWLLFTTFVTAGRVFYLASLLRSTGFLALLAPEWLLAALPSLAENMLSSDPLVYSGVYHYNAAIIPFVMIAAIQGMRRFTVCWRVWRGETVVENEDSSSEQVHTTYASGAIMKVVLVVARSKLQAAIYIRTTALVKRVAGSLRDFGKGILQRTGQSALYRRLTEMIKRAPSRLRGWGDLQWRCFSERIIPLAREIPMQSLQGLACAWVICMLGLNFVIALPALNVFWADHDPGSREQHIQQLLDLIPLDASVSAGANLNPHLSERQHLAVFPSPLNTSVQYIIIDLNTVFPEVRTETASELDQLVASGQFRVLARAEGVVLLVRRST